MRRALCALVFLLLPTAAFAQNPTQVTAPVTPDYSTQIAGVDVLKSVLVVVTDKATNLAIASKDCLKPAPVAGTITCDLPSFPLNKVVTVSLTAVGPGGSQPGAASVPTPFFGPPAAFGAPSFKP